MFKLLPLLLACIWVVCSVATPEPDGRYNLIRGSISSSSSGSSIGGRISIAKPYHSISLIAKSQQRPQLLLQRNAVTSGEDEDNSSNSKSNSNSNSKNNDDLDEQKAIAPPSASAPASAPATASASASGKQQTAATATPSIGSDPADVTHLRAAASPGSASASASTSRSSLLASSSASSSSSLINLPLGSSSSTTTTLVQHHILPAETIPLPITISTRPGLRTVIAPETITIRETTLAKVGEVIQKIPSAVSHQSQTVVHKHARVVTPIVAPAVRTYTSQVLRAYHTPPIFAPQTTVVRSVAGTDGAAGETVESIGAGTKVLVKASAGGGDVGGGGGASASASASIISNANNKGGGGGSGGDNSSANSSNKYKYKY